ncbi:MAG: tetratricopeptide repeat protein [Proteobacteria bacterium]|nr:tetratricopeptide repeat protein [Pseudomonadota bacterium]
MRTDAQGLALTTDNDAAVTAFDGAVEAVAKYRLDATPLVKATLAADPGFALAHCLKGYLPMLASSRATLPLAAAALADGTAAATGATARERRHLGALAAWQRGALDDAVVAWEAILVEHPTDLLALRLSHFIYFWLGRAADMRASTERAAAAWSPPTPGYGTVLAMRAFGAEECGDYQAAEAAGRHAVEIDPGDLWATHAVAHALEMQGRADEGVAWLDGLAVNWGGRNHMIHHLWWHRALFHLERGETDTVLALYDDKIRNLSAPLVLAIPDLYIDIQNAAALLWRLEHLGVAVGARWGELADKAEARIGDHGLIFTLPHYMMAFAAAGRDQAAARLLDAMRDFAATGGGGTQAEIVGAVALPVCAAVLAHRKDEHARVLALMLPVHARIVELGGSHAQRDVFNQLLIDAAVKSGRRDLARSLLDTVNAAWTVGANRRGYTHARAATA